MKETTSLRVDTALAASKASNVPVSDLTGEKLKRLELLYELPIRFGKASNIQELYQIIVERVIEVTRNAKRGVLLVFDPASGKLAVRATIPAVDPPISRTLIQRTVLEESGFIWSRSEEENVSSSIMRHGMETGMYAPLMWQGEIQGVIAVDNPERDRHFVEEDLRFLMTVAHYAANAIANHRLRQDLEEKNLTMKRLLTNFSPSLRDTLVERAQTGGLEPGGVISEVTILFSDIRGFTKLTEGWDSQRVVNLLNDYFALLVEAIFENGGTIDKFIGDGILAVFGSPEPDPQHAHTAVNAAICMQKAMNVQNQIRKSRGEVTCEIGIGIHTGEVLHGFIGATERLEFTVIGEVVNKTARYCSAAQGATVLVSDQVFERVRDTFQFEARKIPTKHEGDFDAYKVLF